MFLGFAAIDHIPKSAQMAIWLVSRITPSEAINTNAVCLDFEQDYDAHKKMQSLLANRILLIVDGSDSEMFDEQGVAFGFATLERWNSFSATRNEEIVNAISEYARREKVNLVHPDIPAPILVRNEAETQTMNRALNLANNIGKTWTYWLKIEHERVRRTVQPKTGVTPWIMPPPLDAISIEEIPAELFSQTH